MSMVDERKLLEWY